MRQFTLHPPKLKFNTPEKTYFNKLLSEKEKDLFNLHTQGASINIKEGKPETRSLNNIIN